MYKVYNFTKLPYEKTSYYDEEMITLSFSTRLTSKNAISIEDIATEICQLSSYIYDKITKEFPDYIQKPFYYSNFNIADEFNTKIEIEIDVPISIFNKRIISTRIGDKFQDEKNFEFISKLKKEIFKNAYIYRVATESTTNTSNHRNRFIGDLMPEIINYMKNFIIFKPVSNPLFEAGDNIYRAVWMLLKLRYDEGVTR